MGWGWGVASASVRVTMSAGQQGALVKKEIVSLSLAWSNIGASCSREVVRGRRPHQDTRGIGHVWLPLSWPQFASTRPLDTLPVSHPLQLSTRGHLTPAFLALKTMFWRFCESCCLLARYMAQWLGRSYTPSRWAQVCLLFYVLAAFPGRISGKQFKKWPCDK